jgi:predicted amidohydrolase
MSDRLRVACVQLNSNDTKAENIERAEGLVARAAATGADLVVLPEKWTGIGPPEMMRGLAESLEDGETVEAMSGWARKHGVTLVGGSIVERREGREKLSNTCVVFDPQGEIQAVYRKIHMFDVEVGGQVYRESETEEPGEATVTTEVEGWKLGLTVCYDLRFPELYRILAVRGARIVAVPSAFTHATGRDHWEVLLRARAIEDQVFVLAPNQVGEAPPHFHSYGRSAIVDPWGVVLATAPDEECFVAADLDLSEQGRVRESLPSLANRRPQAYAWPQLMEARA